MQEKYKVSFVISAGNYDTPPLLDFPRTGSQVRLGGSPRLRTAFSGLPWRGVARRLQEKRTETKLPLGVLPARSAGPNYVIKPDLVHYGGSCSTDFSHISGIRSVQWNRLRREPWNIVLPHDIPRTLAQIYHQSRQRHLPSWPGLC